MIDVRQCQAASALTHRLYLEITMSRQMYQTIPTQTTASNSASNVYGATRASFGLRTPMYRIASLRHNIRPSIVLSARMRSRLTKRSSKQSCIIWCVRRVNLRYRREKVFAKR